MLAPARTAFLLEGSQGSQAQRVLDFEAPEWSFVASGELASAAAAAALTGTDVLVAWTASPAVGRAFESLAPRLVTAPPLPPPGAGHAWDYALRTVSRWTSASRPAPLPPSLEPTLESLERAQPLLARLPPRFLAIHPGSGSPTKNWPAERFAALARELSPRDPWLLVTGPADEAVRAALASEPGAIEVRSLPLDVLGALLSRAGLVLANDSGVGHLAAAFGAPTLSIFGRTDLEVWTPRGVSTAWVRAPNGCLRELHPCAVIATADVLKSRLR